MWRKRQAQASDQQSWRALGTDSALWKGIEKNSGNVKTALGSGTTSGIVTGLKFTNDTGVKLLINSNNDNIYDNKLGGAVEIFYASDPNLKFPLTTAARENFRHGGHTGTEVITTNIPGELRWKNGTSSGTGLVFSACLFGVVSDDKPIPGLKHRVLDGGSGYKVGDKMYLQAAFFRAATHTITFVPPATPPTDSSITIEVTSVTDTKIPPGIF